jgi:hypothetical protein
MPGFLGGFDDELPVVVGNILFHDTQFSLPQVSRKKADNITN